LSSSDSVVAKAKDSAGRDGFDIEALLAFVVRLGLSDGVDDDDNEVLILAGSKRICNAHQYISDLQMRLIRKRKQL